MNLLKKMTLLFILLNLIGCTSRSYFQVYDVKTDNKKETVFEDNNIKIEYNFWADKGNEDFIVYNKTDSNIYINKELSHFIINGYAKTYYMNREWSSSKSNSINQGANNSISTNYYSYTYAYPYKVSSNESINLSTSIQHGTKWKEQRIIVIPPHSYKKIDGYIMNSLLFANCNIDRYPSNKKRISEIKFNKNSTPLEYINYITYSFDSDFKTPIVIQSKFWVDKITFVPYNDFYIDKYDNYCGKKANYTTKYFRYADNSKFYIEYNKNSSFINISNDKKDNNEESDEIDNSFGFKVGDKVIFKANFNKIDAEIVEIKAADSFLIKYKKKNGKEVTKVTSHLWITKK